MVTILVLAVLVVMAFLMIVSIAKSLIVICPPNKVAVISGRSRTLSDGRSVGYRILKGGRTFRWPILEKVSWMDLNTIPLEVSVQNAYSAGAIPLNVQGIANVKISSGESLLENAAERFLDRPTEHIGQHATQVGLEGLLGDLADVIGRPIEEALGGVLEQTLGAGDLHVGDALHVEWDRTGRVRVLDRHLEGDGVEVHPRHLLENGDPEGAAALEDAVADVAPVGQRPLSTGDHRDLVGGTDDDQRLGDRDDHQERHDDQHGEDENGDHRGLTLFLWCRSGGPEHVREGG